MIKMRLAMGTKLFWLCLLSIGTVHVGTTSDVDWTSQCNVCSCIWGHGRRTANCSNKGLSQIPRDLSVLVREIDFSNNALYSLSDGEFVSANLLDVHKLKFQNCSIEVLAGGAFKRVALIIELDLSRNMIRELERDTFRDNVKLRVLILSYNKLRALETGLFHNMSFIQRIHVDHNEIEAIDEGTFYNLPALTDISLGYNRLRTIEFDLKQRLPKLNSLNVEENPWVCDCRLETFHQSIIKNNLITHITSCSDPPRMRGKVWTGKEPFPCAPVIVEPARYAQIYATTSNVTLTCKMSGEPEPLVDWTNNGHVVDTDLRKNKQKYFAVQLKRGRYTWSNLTIVNLGHRDKGEYKCVARNAGGEDQRNISLIVDSGVFDSGTFPGLGGSSGLVIGLSIGLVVLLIIILVLTCLFCKKGNSGALNSKRRELGNSSEECINMSGQHEIKKGLITEVNPIDKPPRVTVPGSVVSGGTEVSDAKRNLLDTDSVFDCEDESRSYDFELPLLQKSHNTLLEPDYRQTNHPYPPDLLSFPPRAQISPAGSNASTVMIDTRLPPHHGPQSPLHSPIYDQLSIYRTLPYSRSHSPFTHAGGPAVPRVPRQGYVTIPRRPRQSWSSEAASDAVGEPLYDNLGVRSTADGSLLSLNKPGTDTLRSNRLLGPKSIVPIAETQHESSSSAASADPVKSSSPPQLGQSAAATSSGGGETAPPSVVAEVPRLKAKPQTPPKPVASQTLPRNLNSTKLTPSRTQWLMDNSEQLRTPSEKRNSIAGDTPSNEGKTKKIPPRPPPKPKKRESSGPLFEDEGEDGTEV